MAATNPELRALLSSSFPGLSSTLEQTFSEAQGNGTDLSQTLQAQARIEPERSRADQLLFISQLLSSTSQHLGLLSHLLGNAEVVCLRDVALRSCSFETTDYPADVLQTLRTRMLGLEPTATVYALLDLDTFPGETAVRAGAAKTLKQWLDAGFDISRDSVRRHLKDPQFLELVPQPDQARVSGLIAVLQCLQAIVTDPLDIPRLIQRSFYSAVAISRTSLSWFVSVVADAGIIAESAERIYHQACRIHRRNEQLWVTALRAKSEVQLAPTTPAQDLWLAQLSGAASSPTDGKINIGNLFPSVMQINDCADCSSITSPAAYFVSMLHQLTKWPVGRGARDKSLLDFLFDRRPDLGELELSCANTNVLLPYVDLVLEALEWVVKHPVVHKTDPLKVDEPYNMDDSDNSDDDNAEPRHVDYSVYQDTIQPMVFPLTQFPYNQAIDSIRSFLRALGTTRDGLATALRSEQRLASLASLPKNSQSALKAAAVLDRFNAAETLGLQQEDYVIITKEAIQTQDFLNSSSTAEYHRQIGLKSAAAYWGYQSTSEMLATGDTSTGLTFIKAQFLPRAGVTFSQFLALLETTYLGGHLVIEMPSGEEAFSGKLDDMRLRYVQSPGAHPAGPLTEDICDRLQAFLRLWKKLQWTIEDTDVAITVLSGSSNTITPDVVSGLAGVQQLSVTTGLTVAELLPLWGDIPTKGPSSTYMRRFMNPRLAPHNAVFRVGADGNLTMAGQELSRGAVILQSALGLTASGFAAVEAQVPSTLSLDSVSQVYRISVLCRLLEIDAEQYNTFLVLYPGIDPFKTPQVTIESVRRFKALTSLGWTLDSLAFITQDPLRMGITDVMGVTVEEVVSTVVEIIASNTGPGLGSDEDWKAKQAPKMKLLSICQILQPLFPDLNAEILQFMLSVVLTVDGQHPALHNLCQLTLPDISHPDFTGYFIPPTTGMYSFVTTQAGSTQTLSVDGVRVAFERDPKDDTRYITPPRRLLNGQVYAFAWSGTLATDLQWITALEKAAAFTPNLVINLAAVKTASVILVSLSQVALLVHSYRLDVEEVHYLHSDRINFVFQPPSVAELEELQVYTNLRDSLPASKDRPSTSALLDFRKWLASPDDVKTLVPRLARLGRWDEALVQAVRDAHYKGLDDAAVVQRMVQDDLHALERIRGAITAASPLLTIPAVSAELLYSLAAPASKPNEIPTGDFSNAEQLRLAIYARRTNSLQAANDQLRENQRAALVEYLLQQEPIRARGLTDADALYEHFLIDVQMGSGMKTSRLKQAISTVQLYVQRCMLGLERDYGVASTSVNRDDWDYMLRYQLWEANRKAFLYPENWIDPTLRDDKSEQFRAFESTVLRTKLTPDSIENALKTYIYAVDEVANLEPLTYLWERKPIKEGVSSEDADLGGVHLFARTRATPYRYFYRWLAFRGPYTDYFTFWKPWTKLDVGIIPQDVDINGRKLARPGTYLIPTVFRGRLYLFLPHLILKTVQSDADSQDDFQSMGNKKPSDVKSSSYWELSMGWTELRNGKWAPKQVSQQVLEITDAVLPHVGCFRFWTDKRTVQSVFDNETFDLLTIEVERFDQDSKSSGLDGCTALPLGQWELRGHTLILNDKNKDSSGKKTLPTDFMRLSWHVEDDSDQTVPPKKYTIDHHGKSDTRVYLTCTDPPNESAEYSWTLSLDELNWDRPTGLLLTVSSGGDSQSRFGYPQYTDGPVKYEDEIDTALMSSVVSPVLMEKATLGSGFRDIFQTLSDLNDSYYEFGFGLSGNVYHELATPAALYSWETGVHAVSLLMERLQSTGQYELALTIARCAFDPTIEGTDLTRCWLFPPFRDENTTQLPSENLGSTQQDHLTLAEWSADRASVHAAARGHPIAYMKRLAMKYIEILLDAGDAWFRQNTLEVLPLAMQRYIEASHVFGAAPVPVPSLGKRKTTTYNDLAKTDLETTPNPDVKLELDFPFQSDPGDRGQPLARLDQNSMPYIETGYFCVPANSEFLALRQRIDDRLFKIRNNMDLYGNVQDRALFEPPLDPGQLMRALASGISPSGFAADLASPMPKYRFRALLEQARRLADELRAMEALIIGIREKKDAEALFALTTSQRQAVQRLVLETKQLEKDEANKAIKALQETRLMHETRLRFYLALTGDSKSHQIPNENTGWEDIPQMIDAPSTDDLRLNPNERLEIEDAHTAMALGQGAASLDTVAAGLLVVPQLQINAQPLGVGMSTEIGTGIVARALQATASGIRQWSDIKREEGIVAGRTGQLIRQLQERRQMANQAGREIKIVDRQIDVQKAISKRVDSEIKALQQRIDDTSEVQQWLQSKYTNEELYGWLDNQYSSLYQDTYRLAADMAQRVQKAYSFENPMDGASYLRQTGAGYWDSSRDGLLAGATLGLDLDRIETAYMNCQPFDMEMEKKISLRQLDPTALLVLRDKACVKFTLPELLFDVDFPGHFCRRIVSVGVQISCIAGPFENLNCTLTLISHSYRVKDDATTVKEYTNGEGFRQDTVPIGAIAVTAGQSDSRQFNPAFQGERYLPFEGAGALSNWQLDLPNPIRQFDYQTIGDVILQLRYTSLRSTKPKFKSAASDATIQQLKSATTSPLPCTLIDLTTDYASGWIRFRDQLGTGTGASVGMTLAGIGRLLPFWTRATPNSTIIVQKISLYMSPSEGLGQLANILSIKEFGSLKWSSDQGSFTGCLVLTADKISKPLPQTWTVQVNNDQAKYQIGRMWLTVGYTVDYK
ncbi:hypothetical protein Aspvir_002786 [Aspergillus viridinutans]|uniref:Uncharacterized protein n=1 Tax=Aspergillus viridinutans TaxID=75553 RepID=A0A9P3C8R3_ASPVI|nr:uncharacterized protein Aspvir_002786 [Aspergillus viridinutans]GIK07131.1 hypothetical protein Aspvir_002786 [Aspergillus viridinutans]